jgi:aspartate aminotransferase
MTGWRLGWAVGNKELIEKMTAVQSQANSHVTSFVQWAGITAAKLPNAEIEKMVVEFDKRRKYCMDRMDKWKEHVSYVRPDGAFYFFVNLTKWLTARKMSDVEFCKQLLTDHHVGAVPGSSFGKEKWLRLSYATSLKNLEKAFDRIEKFLDS